MLVVNYLSDCAAALLNVLEQGEHLAARAQAELLTTLEEAQLNHEEEAEKVALGLLDELCSRDSGTTYVLCQ